jgi:hypothetical protein
MTASQKWLPLAVAGVLAAIILVVLLRPETKENGAPSATTEPSASQVASQLPVASAPSSVPPSSTATAAAAPMTSGEPVDLGTAIFAAQKLQAARAALAAGNAKAALEDVESYERRPEVTALKQDMTLVKIEALAKVGRRTDALALAMSSRDDPAFAPYQGKIQAVLVDAGLE